MTPELAQEWCDALRSGKYPQCAGKLHRTAGDASGSDIHHREGYCCLGVLSEIIKDRPEVAATGWRWDGKQWQYSPECYLTGTLPSDVEVAIGLSPLFTDQLAVANDEGAHTFPQIADMIEREYITPAQSQTS